jgi:hypothetical protein
MDGSEAATIGATIPPRLAEDEYGDFYLCGI